MIDELSVLIIVVERLNSAGITYMITGSIAANFYATPRMTRDIDIVINVEENDIDRLVELFSKDFYIDSEMIRSAIRNRRMFNIIHTLKTSYSQSSSGQKTVYQKCKSGM